MTLDVKAALREAAKVYGTPMYVYCFRTIERQVRSLRVAFGDRFDISYAMKANPNRKILELIHERVDTLDVSSAGEVWKGLEAGWESGSMTFTGPGKRLFELDDAVRVGLGGIVVESVEEAGEVDRIARAYGKRQKVLIRFTPEKVPSGFGVRMAGKPTQFGLDESVSGDAVRRIGQFPNVDLAGFHAFSGTQCLNSSALAENYRIYIDMFRRIATEQDVRMEKCILGSGLGIPYHEGDDPVDLAAVAANINSYVDDARREKIFESTTFTLETGRFLVGEAGFFLTTVIGAKVSRGTQIAVCDGGMNNNLGACGLLGTVIRRNYPMQLLTEDASSRPLAHQDVVGPLCTSIDLLGHNVQMPQLKTGDVIAVSSSGAYGLSASPVNFISHPLPREILLWGERSNKLLDISEPLSAGWRE